MRTWPLYVALLVLTVGSYLPLWRNGFVNFDDEPYITKNSGVQGGLSWPGFVYAWTNGDAPYWHPLTWLSLQCDAQFFSAHTPDGQTVLNPAAFHGQNLFWHTLAALLLFGWWYRVTAARWPSFLIAALFAVHPMHVESVAWAIERKDVLSGFFGVLTLWAYVRYLEKPIWLRYALVPAAYLPSLMAKPMLLTLPCVLLLLDYWPLRRLWPAGDKEGGTRFAPPAVGLIRKRATLSQLLLEKLPLFGLAVWFAALTLVMRDMHGSLVSLDVVPLSARLATALTGYGWYVATTFCPGGLAVLYPHPYLNWSPLSALAGAGVLLGLTALALWQARSRPWLIVGWLWFVGMLLPVSGLAQGGAQAWADRFSYWPHLGLFAAVSYGLADLTDRLRIPAWLTGAVGAVVLGCLAALTWIQVGYWYDSVTLWEHTLAVTRNNERAHMYLSIDYRNHGQVEKANLHLAEAERLQELRHQHDRPMHHFHIPGEGNREK